jgi:S1-C subfamily serine protease
MTTLSDLSADLAELVAHAAPAVLGVEHRRGQGSGVALSPDGYLLTNAHVARGRGPLQVRRSGAPPSPAEVVGVDAATDLAVLRVAGRDLPTLPLSERRLRVGELVLAIGNPLGFDRSVTVGVVSALYRRIPGERGDVLDGLVQTDVSINPGSSGGPLLDAAGAVVGITTAMLPWARGIGFAVPAHTASWVASVLIRDGEVRRPFLGIAARGEELGAEAALAAGHGRAVRVLRVAAGSPAAEAGLAPDDLLLAAGGSPVEAMDDLVRALVLGPSEGVNVEVARRGSRRSLRVHPRRARAAA